MFSPNLCFKAIGFGLLAFWLTACDGLAPAVPTLEPSVQTVPTDLPPIGAEGANIIADAPNPASTNEAVIDTVQVFITESQQPVQVNVVVKGKLPDGCVKIERIGQERAGNAFTATIFTSRQPDVGCIAQLQPFEQVLPLDMSGLAPGGFTVTVSGVNSVSTTFQLSNPNPLAATATPVPFPSPSPSPSPLPLPTALPIPASASISGVVWADFCDGSPAPGCIPDVRGGYRADGTYVAGEALLSGAQVTLSQGGCADVTTYAAKLMTDTDGFYYFGELEPGSYCIAIDTQIEPNRALLGAGDWSYPAPGLGRVEVLVAPGENKTADFGWDQAEQSPPVDIGCIDEAVYVADVTIPDNTSIAPGAPFVKTWRVRNSGTCVWEANYSLVFGGGEAMGGQAPVSLSQPVQPGSEIELSLALVAPLNPGIYRGEWKLQNGNGIAFGSRGNYSFYVQIMVGGPVASPVPAGFTLSGVVWEDFCQVVNGSPSGGCILDGGSGGYRADGLYNNSERGLAGVQVKLSVGECPGNNFVFLTTATDAAGAYQFANLQAGPHCLAIDPLVEPNASLLLPGMWTYPAPNANSVTVNAGVGQNPIADFGWDYQLK